VREGVALTGAPPAPVST